MLNKDIETIAWESKTQRIDQQYTQQTDKMIMIQVQGMTKTKLLYY